MKQIKNGINGIEVTKSHEGSVWQSRDEEMRKLRVNFETLRRAWGSQKPKNRQLKKEKK